MQVTPSEFAKALDLIVINPPTPNHVRYIEVPDICRPGLQFAGYFDVFSDELPQLIGKTEITYLQSLSADTLKERLIRYFSYDLPCIIIARGMECPPIMLDMARANNIPVYGTPLTTSLFCTYAMEYLAEAFAPHQTCHGVLMDIYGVGVLITGESGVGKSECALDLLSRGHRLIADDVVDFSRIGISLFGEAPTIVQDLMELRGVGIIDIKKIFGIGAVARRKKLDLIIQLALWQDGKEYDRLGRSDLKKNILGIDIPLLDIPVRPGRSLSTIIEIAARRWALIKEGEDAAQELDRRLQARYNAHKEEAFLGGE